MIAEKCGMWFEPGTVPYVALDGLFAWNGHSGPLGCAQSGGGEQGSKADYFSNHVE